MIWRGYYYNPAQFRGFQGFDGDSMEYPQYAPVYHDMTGRGTQPSTSHASIAQQNTLQARSMQASASQASSPSSSQSSPDPETVDTGKQSYERWSDDDEKILLNLWVENFDRITDSSQTRRAWDDIANQINLKFSTDNYLPLVRPSVSVSWKVFLSRCAFKCLWFF